MSPTPCLLGGKSSLMIGCTLFPVFPQNNPNSGVSPRRSPTMAVTRLGHRWLLGEVIAKGRGEMKSHPAAGGGGCWDSGLTNKPVEWAPKHQGRDPGGTGPALGCVCKWPKHSCPVPSSREL